MTDLIWWQLQTTFTVLLLATIVFVACRFLKSWPAVQHALWVIVLLKFLLPPIVSWPWTADRLIQRTAIPQGTDALRSKMVVPADSRNVSTNEGSLNRREVPSGDGARLSPDPFWFGYFSSSTSSTSWSWTQPAVQILFGCWIFGATVTAVWNVRSIVRVRRVAIGAEPAPEHLKREVDHVATLLGTRSLPLYISRRVTSPFVCCVGMTRLVWPEGLCSALASYRGVIAHELAHAKRKDHWIAWLDLLAGCIWWWNPGYWYVRRRVTETAEMSCDALALKHLPDDRKEYAEVLLSLSQVVSQRVTQAPALGAGSGACHNLKRRLSMILNEDVKGSRSHAGIVAACLLAVIALPAWSMGPSPTSGPAGSDTPRVANQAKDALKSEPARREARDGQDSIDHRKAYEVVISIEGDSARVSRLKARMTADIDIHAFPGQPFHAQFISISEKPRPARDPNDNRKAYEAVINIEGDPEVVGRFKPGLTADIGVHAFPDQPFNAQIISISDVLKAVVRIKGNAEVLSGLKPRLTADLHIHAFPGETFLAQIISISDVPLPDKSPNLDRKPTEAVVSIKGDPELVSRLRPKLTADVHIHAFPDRPLHGQIISISNVPMPARIPNINLDPEQLDESSQTPQNVSKLGSDAKQGVVGRIYINAVLLVQTDADAEPKRISGIFSVDPGTGDWRQLTPFGHSVRVSPNDDTMAFVRDNELWNCDLEATAPGKLASLPGQLMGLSWTRDGKHISVASLEKGKIANWKVSYDGTTRERLGIPATDWVYDWAPSGDLVVTGTDRHPPKGRGYQLYVMRPDGTEQRRLTRDGLNVYARFSPDGKRIVYTHVDGNGSALRIIHTDGTKDRTILANTNAGAAWSPDGKRLATTSFDIVDGAMANCRIQLMESDGTNLRSLKLRDASITFVQVPPDWR